MPPFYSSPGASHCPLHSLVAHLRSPLLQKCPFSEVEVFLFFGRPLHEKARVTRLGARSALREGISPDVKRLFVNAVALLRWRILGETALLVGIGVRRGVRVLVQSYSIMRRWGRAEACVQVLVRPPGSFPKCSWARKMREKVRPMCGPRPDEFGEAD